MANPDVFYIGSTTQPLPKILYDHKRKYKAYLKGKRRYITSFKILETDPNPRIELVEACPCDSRMELHRTEGKFIRELDCVNKVVAGRTNKEYREDNKEKIKAQQKQHYEDNKEKFKQYYQDNREALLARQEQYRKANKEKINAYQKQYHNREAVKTRKKQYRATKVVCECGCTISRKYLSSHKRTAKHKQLMADKYL